MADNTNNAPNEQEKASSNGNGNGNGNTNSMAEVKKVYGDYEVLKPIGKGKFAVVYRAQRMTDGLVGKYVSVIQFVSVLFVYSFVLFSG